MVEFAILIKRVQCALLPDGSFFELVVERLEGCRHGSVSMQWFGLATLVDIRSVDSIPNTRAIVSVQLGPKFGRCHPFQFMRREFAGSILSHPLYELSLILGLSAIGV